MAEMAKREIYPKDCDFAIALVRGLVRMQLGRPSAAEAEAKGEDFLMGYIVGGVVRISCCDFDFVYALADPMVKVWRKLPAAAREAWAAEAEPMVFREKGGPKCGGSG